MGCHFLLQGIFPTQGLNSHLLPWQAGSSPLSHLGSLRGSNMWDGRLIYEKAKGRFGEGSGNTLQYSCLENPMDRGTWRVTVHLVTNGWTRLSNYTTTTTLLQPPLPSRLFNVGGYDQQKFFILVKSSCHLFLSWIMSLI